MIADRNRASLAERIAASILQDRSVCAPTARMLRARLQFANVAAWIADAEYISFPEVAKHWATLRPPNGSLQKDKTAALADLLEAALDGHLPQLRYLHLGCGVEYLCDGVKYACGDRWCSDRDCVLYRDDDETVHLDSAKLIQMRDCSPLNDGGAYLLDQVAPYCFAPRSALATFLLARGVDRSALAAWLGDLPVAPAAALVIPSTQMRTPKQEAARLALLDRYPDGRVPSFLTWKAITESVRQHYERRMVEIGQSDVGGPSDSNVRRVLES